MLLKPLIYSLTAALILTGCNEKLDSSLGKPTTGNDSGQGASDLLAISGELTGNVIEDNQLISSGQLTTHNQFTTIENSASDFGTFSITADGLWQYQLNNALNQVQALNDQTTLTDQFKVTDVDKQSAYIRITIAH